MNNGEQALVYKHCTIFYSSRPDSDMLTYVPSAAITWEMRGTATTYFLRSLKPEPTKHKAESAALEQAKAWVDKFRPN